MEVIFYLLGAAAILVLCLYLTFNESIGWLTTILIGTFLYYSYMNGFFATINAMIVNLPLILAAFALWIMIGIGWSSFKWKKLVIKQAEIWKELGSREENYDHYRPVFSNFKMAIFTWVIYWPFSFLNYFLGEFIRDVVDKLIMFFKAMYDRIVEQNFPSRSEAVPRKDKDNTFKSLDDAKGHFRT